jgi:cell division GTPase FtsZ
MGGRSDSCDPSETGRCEVNILLLSSGGGGGNILRSLKMLFAKDVATAHKTDAGYAERLRRGLTTRFLDTNEFSLAQVPEEERLLIGAATTHRLGSQHSPELAERALQESRADVERLIAKYSVIVLIGTAGKGTGAGTMFPLAEMVRRQNKLVVPVFVRPSFERHEVDKRRYDHAIHVAAQFDAARIRLIEILNDRAYSDADPQPQSVVWERMNLPIARGLRGLLYVLWDLSQIDPSDLSILFAGQGRMRIGFAEINPADGREPSDAEIGEAIQGCWHNAYCTFSKPVGTSLICIQGDWSNLADAKIKSGIAALALGNAPRAPYNPLYARAFQTPKPWGVTALFTEYTGVHRPLALDWRAETPAMGLQTPGSDLPPADVVADASRVEEGGAAPSPQATAGAVGSSVPREPSLAAPSDRRVADGPPFATVLDFAKALNRLDHAALDLAASEPGTDMAIDGLAVRKLLGTFWFRSVFPRLSESWRERLLEAIVESAAIPNHVMRLGRQAVPLADLSYDQLREMSAKTLVSGAAAIDLQLLVAIGSLWGEQALRRLRFVENVEQDRSSRLAALLGLPHQRV